MCFKVMSHVLRLATDVTKILKDAHISKRISFITNTFVGVNTIMIMRGVIELSRFIVIYTVIAL